MYYYYDEEIKERINEARDREVIFMCVADMITLSFELRDKGFNMGNNGWFYRRCAIGSKYDNVKLDKINNMKSDEYNDVELNDLNNITAYEIRINIARDEIKFIPYHNGKIGDVIGIEYEYIDSLL